MRYKLGIKLIPNLTIMQLYEMSLPVSNASLFYVYGDKLNQDGSISYIKHQAHPPIELLSFGPEMRKCFTYFSHLNEFYRNIDIDVYFMTLTLVHDETDFPLSLYHDINTFGKIICVIHSGNKIFQDNDEVDVFAQNTFYWYHYNMLKIKLMKSPYKTNCHDYDQSGKKIKNIENLIKAMNLVQVSVGNVDTAGNPLPLMKIKSRV